ncbi:alkaline phosphatase D family protein [Fulvivirgaceae bacterium BMA12]|uniref:Alkaline phosphatase D family protein n=1 Tax=Agaribacillus aureus TaxID=3051825 RepID=A0ABT8LDI2_9BACT|nr:alkaline phosphatase D family protein [Fulvivirgaceae bacterium BMA12]
MLSLFRFVLLVIIIASCKPVEQDIFLGQGMMAGEVSATSVILQSRLTLSDTLVAGDLPGKQGLGRFEIDVDSAFTNPIVSSVLRALPESDFIIKEKVENLKPGSRYFYRLRFGRDSTILFTSETGTFKTLPAPDSPGTISFVVVTGMNYYYFHFGRYDRTKAYSGDDKHLGYPALETIKNLAPDYFIGTGDNVYFDHPKESNFKRTLDAGKQPHPGRYGGKEVTDETGMRRKYHEQFVQLRFRELFKNLGTYWEKDDHDYRFNDADPYQESPISHELGIKNFREQVPVVDPEDKEAKTYRTHRMGRDLQIWLLEGRDYRSPNQQDDGPDKTLLGAAQLKWLKETLLASDATFKLIISPTPIVGPDDAYKRDNHVNHAGFRHEGENLLLWLTENDFLKKNLYLICGDRHWQYHAQHPSGFEEFSTGALVDNNARAGRLAGDPDSTDPDGLIKQYYVQGTPESISGGFLSVTVDRNNDVPKALFTFYDETGEILYKAGKEVQK